jgi:hypothetical protein
MRDRDEIRARWSRDGGMGNERSEEDYTDAGCRILARAAFKDVAALLAALEAAEAALARVEAATHKRPKLADDWYAAMLTVRAALAEPSKETPDA